MISALLLNYKRPQNIPKIIEALRRQTVEVEVVLWNNGEPVEGADLTITASKPLQCHVRFLAVGLARSPYVWIQDDDFLVTDKRLFETLVPIADAHPDSFLTADGKILSNGPKPYQCGSPAPLGPALCGNTGYSFARTETMSRLPINPIYCEKGLKESELRWADDIWVSAYVRPFICAELAAGIEHYNEGAVGVSKESGHMHARNTAAARLLQGRTI